jgi:type VI secretion system protein ImpH
MDIKALYPFNQCPDLKVEFILGELLENGLDPEDIVINAMSIFKRRYGKDIVGGEIQEYKTSRRQYLNLDINRNGIYDLLPKGLFHQPQNRKDHITPSQAIEEYKLQKHIETESRLFFLPFEQEIYRLSLLLEAEERKSIFDVRNVLKNQAFIDFWNIPDIFNEQQICSLLYILPLSSFIVGNYPLTKLCFESILNDRFEITETSPPLIHSFIEKDHEVLNHVYLGVNFVIENNFHEVAFSLTISIYPTLEGDLVSYLEGGTKMKMLLFMFDYFLPYEMDITMNINSKENFILAEDSHHARLGISTII